MKKASMLVVAIAVLFLASPAYATIWYVHPDSTLNRIQAGLDSSATGDTVLVGPGVYNECIVWPNIQGIDLISEYGSDMTIIDGNYVLRVVEITTALDSTTVIMGFTIMHGLHWPSGGGIFIGSGSSPIIIGNTITENIAYGRGGGIRCEGNSPIITGNTITNNVAASGGGGISCQTASPIISNNVITDNLAEDAGGGMSIEYGSSALITGNYVNSNESSTSFGGGINIAHNCSVVITDNTVTNNSAPYGGIAFNDASIGTVRHNIITGNICTNTVPSLAGAGFEIYMNSSPTIDSNTIANNIGIGIFCGDNSTPLIQFNNIYGHTLCGVSNEDTAITVSAENNWWGDSTGPYHPTLNPDGQGDSVSAYVDFDPWLGDSVEWVGIEEEKQISNGKCQMTKLQVNPNPFSSKVNIRYQIENNCEAKIEIYDIAGRLTRSFNLQSTIPNVQSSISWDGTDNAGRRLPTGVYFIQAEFGGETVLKKVVKIR